MKNLFKGKNILVTGGTGSIGSQIVRQLLPYKPKTIRVYSRDEFKQYEMMREFAGHRSLRYLVGDVRDKTRLGIALQAVDIVFHAAALKQVPSCEYNPFEAVKTNVIGTQNLIEMAIERNVAQVVGISTDKSVGTFSTMGATKLLAERLMVDANFHKGPAPTIFSCVRFGNVMGSRGSVLPLFKEQIAAGGPVTVTDANMLRFMMSIPEAADLVLQTAGLARGGDVFILKMPVLKMQDLAEVMIENLAGRSGHKPQDIRIEIIGTRVGEKMVEDLISEEEAASVLETKDLFIIPMMIDVPNLDKSKLVRVYPGAKPVRISSYSSKDQKPVTKAEIKKLLEKGKII